MTPSGLWWTVNGAEVAVTDMTWPEYVTVVVAGILVGLLACLWTKIKRGQ